MLKNIVVPLDTSPLAECAAWKAAAIGRTTSATVHLIHVYEPPFPTFDGGHAVDASFLAHDRAQYENHLRRIADGIKTRFDCPCEIAVVGGRPAIAIADFARAARADLLVISTHGRTGMSRAWFGSVADTLARESPVPVLLVRSADAEYGAPMHSTETAFRRVMIALDGSAAAAMIVESVLDLNLPANVELLLAEVVNPIPLLVLDYPEAALVTAMARDVEATDELAHTARVYLTAVAAELRRRGFKNIDTKVLISPATAPAIVGLANSSRSDLVALTSHGRGASRLVLGSVADKVLRGTSASILLRRVAAVAETASARDGKSPTKQQAFADAGMLPAQALSN